MEQIKIHRIYTKNFRFETNEATTNEFEPLFTTADAQIQLLANPRFKELKPNYYELILAMQITLHDSEDKPLLSIYLEQAGLLTLPLLPTKKLEKLLYGAGSNLLFPYAGVTINTLLTQAALPPIYIAPQDFMVMYERYEAEQAKNKMPENFFVSSSYNEKTIH